MVSKNVMLQKFSALDLDGNGTIERQELGKVLEFCGGDPWADTAIDELFDCFDTNRDGKIQLEEFMDFVFQDERDKVPSCVLNRLLESLSHLPPTSTEDRALPAEGSSKPEPEPETALSGEARIKELRRKCNMEVIPDWLETQLTVHHLKHTPLTSGEHNLKLKRIAPHSQDGNDCLVCLLDDTGSYSISHYLYRFQEGRFAKLDAGIELLNEIDAKLPDEIKLLCRLCVGAGGRQTCSFSLAMRVLSESRLCRESGLTAIHTRIRSEKEFATLEEVIHQFCDPYDPETTAYLKRAYEEPDKVWAELSWACHQDVKSICGEPDLDIDWIVAQIFPGP